MFFNDKGILNIDEMVAENVSFRKIMEDGIVTEQEIKEQAQRVVEILRKMETSFSEEQLTEVRSLLAESGALYAAYNIYSLQNINR